MALLNDSELPLSLLHFYNTAAYPCSYLAERQAVSLVATPTHLIDGEIYGQLLHQGFRRSGVFTYRPECPDCRACVPVRIAVEHFRANRSQRRCLKRNADVDARIVAPLRTAEHLALYRKYLTTRHRGGGMDDHGAPEFEQFLIGSWNQGRFLELREHGSHRLLAVAVTDLVDGALSAVYTFYDPDQAERGLGTLAVLKQLEWAARDRRAHLYLGYWIAGHAKMDYKRRFQPLEGFNGRGWARLQA